jgi:hypothetical protein
MLTLKSTRHAIKKRLRLLKAISLKGEQSDNPTADSAARIRTTAGRKRCNGKTKSGVSRLEVMSGLSIDQGDCGLPRSRFRY